MTRLDLGCGCRPTGDVNVDLYPQDIGHRAAGKKNCIGPDIPKCLNFVKWDLNKLPLPFESNSFNEVYCSHTIEHVDFPFALLSEMVRISSNKVIVICPHRLGERATMRKNLFHKSYFGCSWFHQAADKLHCTADVKISRSKEYPCIIFPLIRLPFEITAEMKKQ